jgi:DNA replication protein DnaC
MQTIEDDKPAAALSALLPIEITAPTIPVDLDEVGQAYLMDSIAITRRDYFRHNCPADYREFDPSRIEIKGNEAALARVTGWKHDRKGLLLSGPSRRGKTRSAYALCRRLLCDELRDVAMWQAHDFFSALQDCVRYGRDEADGWVKRMAARPVFFLDDYGQHAALASRAEWAEAWFFRFLDLRIGAGLPLIVTTNLSAQQMKAAGGDTRGDPLVARFLELAEPVKFN